MNSAAYKQEPSPFSKAFSSFEDDNTTIGTFRARDGVQVYFEDNGSNIEPAETALFYIYGLGCSIHHWHYQMDHFSAGGNDQTQYRQIWLEFRGQGESERPIEGERLGIDMIVNDIIDLCHERNIKRAIFLGQSMGGCLAMRLASKAPWLVGGIVLLASPGGNPVAGLPIQPLLPTFLQTAIKVNRATTKVAKVIDGLKIRLASKPMFRNRFFDVAVREAFRHYGFNPKLSRTHDIESYLQRINEVPSDLFLDLAADLEKFDISNIENQLNCPTLIISGQQDMIIPISEARRIHRLIPGSQLEIVEHGSHCPHFDDPELVSGLIEEFVNSL